MWKPIEFQFLSELYERDAPHTVLLPEYPSSNNPEARFKNLSKYIIHDPFPPPPVSLIKILGPHHLMCCWGNRLAVTSEVKPPNRLLQHWASHFGAMAIPHWQEFSDRQRYTTIFPIESLDPVQQEIDPDTYYRLHSKETIGEIDCPQATILNDVQPPCIVKLSHGYAGLGNFMVHSIEEKRRAMSYVESHWPDAKTVTNSIIDKIVGDFGVQFYLTKSGILYWLGFTRQKFDNRRKWSGATFSCKEQSKFDSEFQDIAKPVADYLHQHSYYGLVGIDILKDQNGKHFLVDLNPRLTGVTPFLLASRKFSEMGHREAIYAASIAFKGTFEQLIEIANRQCQAAVLIHSAITDLEGSTRCHVSVHSETQARCRDVMNRIANH